MTPEAMKVVIRAWNATRLRFMCFYSALSVTVLEPI